MYETDEKLRENIPEANSFSLSLSPPLSPPLFFIFLKRGKTIGDGQSKIDLAKKEVLYFFHKSHMSSKYPILIRIKGTVSGEYIAGSLARLGILFFLNAFSKD